MGVTGLWKLIEPCGKPVPVETLEGKILAVDISIWLHQVVKGFQDNKGAALNNAHLLGLFHRLCKLMYYRVKPVFVFDGCVPQLKKDTIARRQQQRSKLNSEADRIQALLLQSLAKEKVVQQALGSNAELLLKSPIKKLGTNKGTHKEDSLDDMFKLPELPSSSKSNPNHAEDENTDESFNENSFCSDDYSPTSTSTDGSSFDESNSRRSYNSNIQAIDVKSKEFLQLPADIRHEILVDIKETRKQSSWGRLHELPSHSDDFSNFQMKRLLKRRDVQVSLEAAEQEMGGHTLTYAELTNIFSEEGILETDIVEKGAKQITSDEHTRFLLVKDLKKKLGKVEKETEETKNEQNTSITESSPNEDNSSTSKDEGKNLGKEYDVDLEFAIALSLEDDSNRVYDEKDYEYDSDESLKLSKKQRQQLQNAARGPARSYMIEYAGMNKEEVAGILEKTQTNADLDDNDIEEIITDIIKTEQPVRDSIKDTSKEEINSTILDIGLCVTDDSDATDSDLEEVEDNVSKSNEDLKKCTEMEGTGKFATEIKDLAKTKITNEIDSDFEEIKDSDETDTSKNKVVNKTLDLEEECVVEETPPCLEDEEEVKTTPSKTLNIQIDLTNPLEPEDDLFADIFEDIQTEGALGEKSSIKVRDHIKEKKSLVSKGNKTIESSAALSDNSKEDIEATSLNDGKLKVQIKTPPKAKEIISILNELKQEADDIKNIKLENIKLIDSVIEISDDETRLMISKVTKEVIDVCDSDENEKRCATPPSQAVNFINKSPSFNTRSPNYGTPTKNHSIKDFFTVNYVVKRTPDKPNEENETVAKVESPFFVRKTPKSGCKRSSNSPSLNKRQPKVNKTLFDEAISKDMADKLDNDIIPLKEAKPVSKEDVLNEAANILKLQKTSEELSNMASDLAKERQELENARNRQDRMGMSITQRMNSDCQDLLRLFGIPFIVAPMEAEAQCAFLDIIQLTNGTITDDSDIWLFGGRTVYKNFFAQNKHVMEFRSEQIEKDFNCDRKKLIQLACLVGSDYTTGIHGIGAVTALEILASFTPKETLIQQTSIDNILATLQKFRNWWESFRSAAAPPGSSARLALQKKLKNIELHDGFPSTAVVEAYLTPKVDQNKDAFSWGYPDVESLREFARKSFGWTTSKTDEILMPVLKKLNEKRTQQSIRNYFNVKNALSLRQIRVSKRVQNAIENMTGSVASENMADDLTKSKRSRKSKTAPGKKNKEGSDKALNKEVKQVNDLSSSIDACCSNQTVRGPVKRTTKRNNIHETKQLIPQREKYLAQIEANKKLAAEIFKNTAKEAKKKREA